MPKLFVTGEYKKLGYEVQSIYIVAEEKRKRHTLPDPVAYRATQPDIEIRWKKLC